MQNALKIDDDYACKECGEAEDYVCPDTHLCDICLATARALKDTVTIDQCRADLESNH